VPNQPQTIMLDLRGEICPVPLVKVLDAIKGASNNQMVQMVTDFLPAVLTTTNAALKQEWDINIHRSGPKEWNVIFTRSGVNTSPT